MSTLPAPFAETFSIYGGPDSLRFTSRGDTGGHAIVITIDAEQVRSRNDAVALLQQIARRILETEYPPHPRAV